MKINLLPKCRTVTRRWNGAAYQIGPCGKPVSVVVDGKPYCPKHNPHSAKYAQWEKARMDREARERRSEENQHIAEAIRRLPPSHFVVRHDDDTYSVSNFPNGDDFWHLMHRPLQEIADGILASEEGTLPRLARPHQRS